jgi:hypothetical protein
MRRNLSLPSERLIKNTPPSSTTIIGPVFGKVLDKLRPESVDELLASGIKLVSRRQTI